MNNIAYDKYLNFEDNYFCFKGFFTEDNIYEIGNLIKINFASHKNKQRIYSVFIEMTQNVSKYSEEKNKEKIGKGIFIFKEDEEYFYLISGNQIKNNISDKIENILKEINVLDLEELKKLYKNKIREPYSRNKIGANVGFIDMSRKSENPLSYQFKEIDKDYSFFSLIVKLKKGD